MAEGSRSTLVGNAGGTAINVDLRPLDHASPVKVTLSANYTTAYPAGYPSPPFQTGTAPSGLNFPKTILSGTVILLLAAEAAALIAAGKAS